MVVWAASEVGAALGNCHPGSRKASPMPEKTGRRNITLSPKDGTPVVVSAIRPARERQPAAV